MDYCGDSLEDIRANEKFYEILGEDNLYGMSDEALASDYFKFGWEAAMQFVKETA